MNTEIRGVKAGVWFIAGLDLIMILLSFVQYSGLGRLGLFAMILLLLIVATFYFNILLIFKMISKNSRAKGMLAFYQVSDWTFIFGIISAMAASMVISLAACGSSNDSLTETAVATVESKSTTEASVAEATVETKTEEQVDLVFYVMGDAPVDEVEVENAVNAILLEKCNATIDMQFSRG